MTTRTFMPFRVYWGVSSTAKYSLCCGDRARTCDLYVMSVASYHCSTPRFSVSVSVMSIGLRASFPGLTRSVTEHRYRCAVRDSNP